MSIVVCFTVVSLTRENDTQIFLYLENISKKLKEMFSTNFPTLPIHLFPRLAAVAAVSFRSFVFHSTEQSEKGNSSGRMRVYLNCRCPWKNASALYLWTHACV